MTLERILNYYKDFQTLPQSEKVKVVGYVISTVDKRATFTPKELYNFFHENNLDPPSNMSRELTKISKERPRSIIKIGNQYALERNYIKEMDLQHGSAYSIAVSKKMEDLLDKVKDTDQKSFLKDALICFENKIYRASILLTWLVVLDILYDEVLANHLVVFNAEVAKQNKKFVVKKKADFEDIKESIFIEALRAASIISKEQKKVLDEKLTIRNSAAHPNKTSFMEAKVASFIEELLIDVVDMFNQ